MYSSGEHTQEHSGRQVDAMRRRFGVATVRVIYRTRAARTLRTCGREDRVASMESAAGGVRRDERERDGE